MVDNTTLPGTGDVIATDDIAGVKHQLVKVEWGPADTANQVDTASGKPLPVQLRSPTGTDLTGTAGTSSAAVLSVQGIASGTAMPVSGTFWQATQPVSGTFWQATQPVSIATAPVLVAGAAVIGKVGIDQTTDGTTNLVAAKQSGTWNVTNVSGTISLPTGAATAAKQPALGTAGSASTDVITVQGIASGTAQPVSGTFWQTTQPVSIATAPALVASSAVIGKVGIDQTTDGTTNLVRLGAETTKLIGVAKVGDGTNSAAIKAASTAPAATDPALVVAISPNSVNANGQATMANSAPVVLASNQASIPVAATLAAETTKVIGVVQGAAASGASASGNPLPAAGLAVSSETAVTNGQAAALITDLARKLIVLPYANPENFVSGAITSAMTGTTSTSLVAAPASGLRNYITTIIVSNSHATVGTDIIIQDGSGGTTLMTIPAAAVYGGAVINLPVALRQPTTATAIYCANVTTGASTKVSAVGYKGA